MCTMWSTPVAHDVRKQYSIVVQATTLNTLGLMRARKEQQRQQVQQGQG